MEREEFMKYLREHQDKLLVPGAMLMKYGPKDYVGATMAITGTLYFTDAHTPEVRQALCTCFEEYKAVAGDHLTWLWHSNKLGKVIKVAYSKADSLPNLLATKTEDHSISYHYISGKTADDASGYDFEIFGRAGWKAKMGNWGLDVLRFTLPILYVEENPLTFQRLFVSFARHLKAQHGHGGFGFVLSPSSIEPNEATEAFMSEQMKGADVGDPAKMSSRVEKNGIKTVSWLTAINNEMVEKAGGLFTLRSALPLDWFAKYDYGAGIVIQAGPKPEIAAVEIDPKPAIYVLPNMALKDVRIKEIGSIHYGSKDGEPRLVGWAAEQWLQRFDVLEEELLKYKAKLLNEPKLTKDTTLPEQM